jgi:heme A synthase
MGVVIRRNRGNRPLQVVAMVVTGLIVLQIAAGALVVELGLPGAMRALHIALASGLWATVVLVAVLTRVHATATVTEVPDPQRIEALRGHAEMVTS